MRQIPKNQPLYALGLIIFATLYLGGINWLKSSPTTKYQPSSDKSTFEEQELINNKLTESIADYKNDLEKLAIERQNNNYFDVGKYRESKTADRAKGVSQKEAPKLKSVDAIMVTSAGAIAIIDGVAMREGQTIKSGEKILTITSEQVKLVNSHGKISSIGIRIPLLKSKNRNLIQDYQNDK